MNFIKRFSAAALLAVAAVAPIVIPATPASASPTNGELCSVTNSSGNVRASVYAYPPSAANRASRAQVGRAGEWCTIQVQTPGWYGADKDYDRFTGQTMVCWIHFPIEPVSVAVYASADENSMTDAEQDCRDVTGGNPNVISWYPT